MPTDFLLDEIVSTTDSWARQRDQEYRDRWQEYYRTWRGRWQEVDRTRQSERSHYISPSTSQAIDSAVADVIEALFSREQWLTTGNAMLDDLLLADLWNDRPNIEEAILLGALYGTIISKVQVELRNGRPVLDTVALHPEEFIVDPSASSLQESYGVGHHVFVPRWIVERRMRDGIYSQVSLDGADPTGFVRRDSGEPQPRDSDYIELMEWWGLIPIEEVEARERTDQLRESAIGDDNLVEAVCTVANQQIVLRCEANPYGGDRPFIAAQWHTVPRRIWGRGVAEAAYWPQKGIDAEMRARQDALAYSTVPMMAVSASQVPRSERFETRPGRNIFVRGDARTAMAPVQFSGPDPGTYEQTLELQRMIELGTGQLSQANPIGDMSRTGSGPLSAVLGASVKRSARTLMNIERDFVLPLIRKAVLRMHTLRPDIYPLLEREPKIVSGVGIMMRELENQQLANLMTNLPDGAAQLAILRMIVDGSALREKTQVMQIVDSMIEKAMAPEGLSPDQELAMAAMQNEQQRQQNQLQLDTARLRLDQQKAEQDHYRRMLELGIRTEEVEARVKQLEASAELDQERADNVGSGIQ